MTPKQKLQVVETTIRKALPRLLEDTNGCIFKDNWHNDLWKKVGFYTRHDGKDVIVLRNTSNNEVFVDFDNTFCVNSYEDVCHTLIGHDILLNDVLEWINKEDVSFLGQDFLRKTEQILSIILLCDLSKPRLADQSEELWDFLYHLIK